MEPDPRHEIARLIYEYPACLDRGDLAGVARLFANATVHFGSGREVKGQEALERWFTDSIRTYEGGATHVHHLVGNLVVELEDMHHAMATSYYQTCQAVPPDFPLQLIIAGRYMDRFEVIDGVWEFTERRYLRDFTGDVSFHVHAAAIEPIESSGAVGE